MSRSQQIRDALRGQGEVSLDTIIGAIGAPPEDERKVRNLISALRKGGEVENGSKSDTYVLVEQQRRQQRTPKGERQKMREIADKAREVPDKKNAGLQALIVSQLIAAGAHLRATLREHVEGLDDNESLRTALALHEGAERIAKETTV